MWKYLVACDFLGACFVRYSFIQKHKIIKRSQYHLILLFFLSAIINENILGYLLMKLLPKNMYSMKLQHLPIFYKKKKMKIEFDGQKSLNAHK